MPQVLPWLRQAIFIRAGCFKLFAAFPSISHNNGRVDPAAIVYARHGKASGTSTGVELVVRR